MAVSEDKNPVGPLGLPDPETVQLSDPQLQQVYKEFCTSWQLAGFSSDDFSESDYPKLRLLRALVRPTREEMEQIVDKISSFQSADPHHASNPGITAALREFQEFPQTADYKALTKNLSPGKILLALTSSFSSAPGLTWSTEIEVSRFNKDWAVVLYYGDAQELQVYSFPAVIGFACRKSLVRSVGEILEAEYDYSIGGSDESRGGWADELLMVCWKHGWEHWNERFSYGSSLLQLTDRQLQQASKEYGTLDALQFLQCLQEIVDLAEEDPDLRDVKLSDIVKRYGRRLSGQGRYETVRDKLRKRAEIREAKA